MERWSARTLWTALALFCAAAGWNVAMDPGASNDGSPDGAIHELVAVAPMVLVLLGLAYRALRRLRPLPSRIEHSAPDTLIAMGCLAQVVSIAVVSVTDVADTYQEDYISLWIVGAPAMLCGLASAYVSGPRRRWLAVFNLSVFGLLILLSLVGFLVTSGVVNLLAALVAVIAVWVWVGLGLARLFSGGPDRTGPPLARH